MDTLQELLKWLSEADEYQIDGLYECLINERVHYIKDCFKDKDIYKDFIKDIEEETKQNINCYKCNGEINGEILCENCLKGEYND